MIPSIDKLLEQLPRRIVKLPDEYYDKRVTRARDLAFTVSGVSQLDIIQLILDSLDKNIASGGTFRDWKKQLSSGEIDLPQLPRGRLELIFRNHGQTAYMAGKCKNFDENKTLRPYLRYSAISDSRTRPAHLRLDGVIRPVGDEWWREHMPPNGHNCRCSVVSLTERQAKKMGGITENPPQGGADPKWDYSPCRGAATGETLALERKIERYHPRLRELASKLLMSLKSIR